MLRAPSRERRLHAPPPAAPAHVRVAVRAPTAQCRRTATEFGGIVERAAAARAASRDTGDDLAAMVLAYDQMRARAKHGVGFIDADISFHAAIVTASHNELLDRLTSAISAGL